MPTYSDDELQQAAAAKSPRTAHAGQAAGLHAKPETAEVTFDGTWHTILDVAEEYEAGLIVVGARGLSRPSSPSCSAPCRTASRNTLTVPCSSSHRPSQRHRAGAAELESHGMTRRTSGCTHVVTAPPTCAGGAGLPGAHT